MYSSTSYTLEDYGPNYSNLPMEILVKIFTYLHPNDRCAAGLACHRWLEATQHPLFRNDMTLALHKVHFNDNSMPVSNLIYSFRSFPSIVLSQVEFCDAQEFWTKFGEHVQEITLKACDIREKIFNNILKSMPNLQTLRVEACRELFMSGRLFESAADRQELSETMKNLTTLSLMYNRYLSDALFNRIIALVPNLENIDLSGCHISFHKGLYRKFYPGLHSEASESVLTFHYISQFIEHQAKKLKVLNFSSTLIDGTALIQLSEIPNLQLICLNLNACDQLTNPGIITLAQRHSSLQYLDLSKSVRLTDQCLVEICDHLVNLKSLKLRRCRALTDLGVKELVKLNKLELLDISECESVTGQGILYGIASQRNTTLSNLYVSALNLCESSVIKIAENFPSLVLLDLSFCINSVTDLCLQIIFKHLTLLRHLNLDLCDKISDAAMTGMSMGDKVAAHEHSKTVIKDDTMSKDRLNVENVSSDDEEMPIDVLNRYNANVEAERARPFKISLRSKAEQEIVNDAKRKKEMIQMCEQKVLDESESSGYSIARLRGLRVLRLSQCNKLSDVSLIYSFKLMELKEISLARCQQVSVAGIQALVQNCPSLEVVDLNECHNINDKAIELITKNLKRLNSLSVERCVQLTDFSLDYIAIHCKSLRTLDVRGCRSMCPEPNLRLINVATLRTIHMSKPGPYMDDMNYLVKKPKPPPMPRRI